MRPSPNVKNVTLRLSSLISHRHSLARVVDHGMKFATTHDWLDYRRVTVAGQAFAFAKYYAYWAAGQNQTEEMAVYQANG
jgi:hypothetical protein